MKEKLIQASRDLQQITVKGVDAIRMANALIVIEQILKEMDQTEEAEKWQNTK